jgi:hypothetical protein
MKKIVDYLVINGGLRWTAILIGAVLLAGTARPLGAAPAAYYVATNGSDSNPGTSLNSPFRTIQKCASVAHAGDTCWIRGGVYRETVRPARSGASGAPITFRAYNQEVVIINGADVVTGWVQHNGSIYRAPMAWSLNVRTPEQITNNQVFVDGRLMVEARWPNISPDRLTRAISADKARADGAANVSQYAATYQDAALGTLPSGLFDGGKINFGPGTNIVHTTCDVTSQTGSAVSFQCNRDPAAWGVRSDLMSHGDMLWPQGGNYYYLWGKFEALDAPGEWFWQNNTLYLWLPDGGAPSGHVVEARRRLWAFDLSERDYIVVDGLRLFAAGIKYDTRTDHTTVQNARIDYSWHFEELPILLYANGTSGLRVLGANNSIQHSTLAHSAGEMISLGGTNNRVYNNVIYNAGYTAVSAAVVGRDPIYAANPGGASSNLVSQNTIFDVGRLGVAADPGLNITYNDLYRSHLQITDLGTVYAQGLDGKNAHIAYNLVHDNSAEYNYNLRYWGGFGIYLDDNTRNYRVYRNITWNTTSPGMFAFGTQSQYAPSNRFYYQNTVDGVLEARAKPGQTMGGTFFRNNIGDSVRLSGPGLVDERNLAGTGWFVDRAARDYRLRQDVPPVDAGLTLGSPYQDPPMAPVGAPDIGALERGRAAFVAGALVRSLDLAGLQVVCNTEVSGATAICRITDLPLGRRLPADFEIAIGTTAQPARTCTTTMNYTTHTGQATCPGVPTGGLSGVQPIHVRIGAGSWVTPGGSADLGGLALLSVTPSSGITKGGTRVTVAGRRFDTALAGWVAPLTINNASGASLYSHQVLVVLDTAARIGQGKMHPDCSDVSFYDQYGELDFWLEDGCNTAATRLWVKVGHVPTGDGTITLAYGHGGQTKTSSGHGTFVFFDDFEDGIVSRYWTLGRGDFYTAQERDGAMVLSGATNNQGMYLGADFHLNDWLLTWPDSFAIDSELSVVRGASGFKANLGATSDELAVSGQPSGNPPRKDIAYYDGSWWVSLGKSTLNSATFTRRKFSLAYSEPGASRTTLRWMENGDLNQVLATRTGVNNPHRGFFLYGADAVAAFEARFDNVRVRSYAYPEPSVRVGTERASGIRITFGGLPCTNIAVIDPSTAQCTTPPRAPGSVSVTVTNPDGQRATLDNAFTYREGYTSYLPVIKR